MLSPADLPDVDNIGFVTPKFLRHVLQSQTISSYLKSLRVNVGVIRKLSNAGVNLTQAVAFHGQTFQTLWDWLTSELGYPVGSYNYKQVQVFYHNAWVAKRSFVAEFLDFMKPAFTLCDNAPETFKIALFSNSHYNGALNTKKCREKFGTPHYPFHPFIFERLICFFTFLIQSGRRKLG
jgi:hypothetical protein